jgi:hypothetical protein
MLVGRKRGHFLGSLYQQHFSSSSSRIFRWCLHVPLASCGRFGSSFAALRELVGSFSNLFFALLPYVCHQAAGVKGVKQIMLDIEGPTWNFTQSENRDYVLALRSAVERGGLNVTVYCTNWPETFGPDFTAFKDVPLIYAVRAYTFFYENDPIVQLLILVLFRNMQHYDLVPSYYDYIEHPFGGWVVCFTPACVDVALHRIAATCLTSTCQVPDGKQFWDGAGDVEVCGFTGGDNLDWSVLLRTQRVVHTLICSPNLTGIGVPRHSGSFQ